MLPKDRQIGKPSSEVNPMHPRLDGNKITFSPLGLTIKL